ncbi:Uncharacterised protein [Serratia plymuthica]|nr:Uncharacterised protein [Serratia plymuthica]
MWENCRTHSTLMSRHAIGKYGAILLSQTLRDDPAKSANVYRKGERPRSLWAGVVRHNGKDVFVRGVLPGWQAEIQLTEEKR